MGIREHASKITTTRTAAAASPPPPMPKVFGSTRKATGRTPLFHVIVCSKLRQTNKTEQRTQQTRKRHLCPQEIRAIPGGAAFISPAHVPVASFACSPSDGPSFVLGVPIKHAPYASLVYPCHSWSAQMSDSENTSACRYTVITTYIL